MFKFKFKHVIINMLILTLEKDNKTPNQTCKGKGGFARWQYSFLHITW
jgi:hypothetical protein